MSSDLGVTIAKINGYLRAIANLSREIGVAIDVSTVLTIDGLALGCATVGDYERRIMTDGSVRWNYRPKVLKGDAYDVSLYQDDVNPARIVSFTMPPREQP